jgi:Na+/phosphate symporter
VATFFSPLKVFLPLSLLVFGLGFGYYLYTYFVSHRFTNMGLLLLVLGALVLSLGLVSEQVASLRFEKAESGWEEEST